MSNNITNRNDIDNAWKQFETTGKINDYLIYNGLAGETQTAERPELLENAALCKRSNNRPKKDWK